jgi:hypothetical protein
MRFKKTLIAMTLALLLSFVAAAVTFAQGSNTNPILAALETLIADVANVQESVDALGAEPGTIWTPPLFADEGFYVRCMITNVSDAPIEIIAHTLQDGQLFPALLNTTLDPLETERNILSSATVTLCKFTVPSASAVRATACVNAQGVANATCLATVDAR